MIITMALFSNTVKKTPLLAKDNTHFVKATVVKADNLLESTGGDTAGDSQKVALRITSGEHKGEVVSGYSLNGYLYGANCKEGTKVIVKLSEYEGSLSASVYNYDRETQIIVLIVIFFAFMCIVGGRKGVDSVFALIFTVIVVALFYIPLMYVGVSPFLAATVSVVLITVMTHILIADMKKKSISAMFGSICGVVVAGIIAMIFGKVAHINGYNVDEIETLIYIGQNSKLDIGGMLFSGILIASLGAVMDVAMSVSSALNELNEAKPEITFTELFKSGINIGRDMIGTMSNTLILAYVGTSVNLMMIIYSYSYEAHQILNMYSVAIEIMRGISGTLGIILTVPFTAFITAWLFKRKYKKCIAK